MSLSSKGKRLCNEDFLSVSGGAYIICDGVGGSAKGEIASKLACEAISNYFLHLSHGIPQKQDVMDAIINAEDAFTKYVAKHPESNGMATTLALLHIFGPVAMMAHAGDSRIYHVRNGTILYQTKDHSLINDLIDAGYIREEEAKWHTQRSVITRAIQGKHNPALADVKYIYDIRQNDFFILCTDGLLEGIDNHFIEKSFVCNAELGDLVKRINSMCEENADDNFSAIFIEILSS